MSQLQKNKLIIDKIQNNNYRLYFCLNCLGGCDPSDEDPICSKCETCVCENCCIKLNIKVNEEGFIENCPGCEINKYPNWLIKNRVIIDKLTSINKDTCFCIKCLFICKVDESFSCGSCGLFYCKTCKKKLNIKNDKYGQIVSGCIKCDKI